MAANSIDRHDIEIGACVFASEFRATDRMTRFNHSRKGKGSAYHGGTAFARSYNKWFLT
jgi:hypothetical protein